MSSTVAAFIIYGLFIGASFLGLMLLGILRQNQILKLHLEEAIKQLRVRRISGGR